MAKVDLIIRGQRVVLPDAVVPGSIHISNGRILSVESYENSKGAEELVNVDDDSVIMPALVDTHVHINSPGRTEWEGFASATRAAAAGGVTTVVDMPLNSIPPTTTIEALRAKISEAENSCYVDVGFWGGVVPGNTENLAEMWHGGVVGFKCFLVPTGVEEFPHVNEADLRTAMSELAGLNAPLIVHAELPGPIADASISLFGDPTHYDTFLTSRPRAAENEAVALMISLSREFDARVHIVHLSSADVLPILRDAQAAGIKISAETCPHYLHFAAEQVASRATEFKCCPPIREQENRELLWKGLASRTIAFVVSDHSPCPAQLKIQATGNFLRAWGGISSLQLRLPVVWTDASQRGFSLCDLAEWLSYAPALQVDLLQSKGSIEAGKDADIVIWDPDEEFQVDPRKLHHRHQLTPYAGERLRGVVKNTFLRGQKIYDGAEIGPLPQGQLILRRHE
jgi:allantoinase